MIVLRNKSFAEREKVPDDIMEKVERTGVIQQDREEDGVLLIKRNANFGVKFIPQKNEARQLWLHFMQIDIKRLFHK